MTRPEKIEQIKTVIAGMRKDNPVRMDERDQEYRSYGYAGLLGWQIELMDDLHAMGYTQYEENF